MAGYADRDSAIATRLASQAGSASSPDQLASLVSKGRAAPDGRYNTFEPSWTQHKAYEVSEPHSTQASGPAIGFAVFCEQATFFAAGALPATVFSAELGGDMVDGA